MTSLVNHKKYEIRKAFSKHFDQAYFINWGNFNGLYLKAGKFKMQVDMTDAEIEARNPYDIVNAIWEYIYANFSDWCRV